MINVEDYIKQAYHSYTTQRKSRIFLNNQYYDIVNLSYEKDCYDEGNVIGNAIACKIEFDIPSMNTFDTFTLEEGIFVNDEYNYINLGQFKVIDEKDKDSFFKHIVAMDLLVNFNAEYVDNGEYPKTLYGLLQEVCQQAQVNLINTSIVNGDFTVTENQFVNNESLKFVLKQICGLAGTYATIQNNQLILQLKNTGAEVLSKSDYSTLDLKRQTRKINQVIITMAGVEGEYALMQDDDDIALNGVVKIEIVGNYFAYIQEKREQLIEQLYNQLRGFGYLPYELKGEWLPYLELGDTVNIEGTDTILLRISGKSPKGLESNLSAPAIIDSTIEFMDNTNSLQNRQRRTEIIVNKEQQTVQTIIADMAETNSQVQSQITEILQTTSGTQTSVEIRGGNNLIKNSPQVFGYDDMDLENGTAQGITNTELNMNTVSKTGIAILGTVIKQDIPLVIGRQYTLSMLYTNPSGNQLNISAVNGNITTEILNTTESENLQRLQYTFIAAGNQLQIIFESANSGFYYADLMLNTGDTALPWQPSIGETIGVVIKQNYDGQTIESYLSGTRTITDANGFRIIESRTNNIILSADTTGIFAKNITTTGYIDTGQWKEYEQNINGTVHKIEIKEG